LRKPEQLNRRLSLRTKCPAVSKGFGFVEFATEEEAQKAIEMFNGKDFDGRKITVSEARPMEPRPRRNFDHGDRGFGEE